MRIAHAKEKKCERHGKCDECRNIMQSLNVRDLFIVKKKKKE